MKTKNFKKKLTLNKKTIADFRITDTRVIHGGIKNPRTDDSILFDPCPSGVCGTNSGNPCKDC
jgi:hypothetical protein